MQGDLQCISFFMNNPKKFAIHFIFAVKSEEICNGMQICQRKCLYLQWITFFGYDRTKAIHVAS